MRLSGQRQIAPINDSASVPAALSMHGVSKSFGSVRALKAVDFAAYPGEIRALVGENGAGKSTLMAVASGMLGPDEGSVTIGGSPVQTDNPTAARDHGLGIVSQHPVLIPDLTVVENLALSLPRAIRPKRRDLPAWFREQIRYWGAEIDPLARVEDVPLAHQHLIEVVRVLALSPKVLILDEPTEHMNASEVARLFRKIRDLAAGGTAIVYISHRIHEVKAIADQVTVLRDGEIRGTFDAASVTEKGIVDLVVGRTLASAFPPKSVAIGRDYTPIFKTGGLSGKAFEDVSLSIRRGEIIGLAGIEGNGQREFLRALAGLEASRGEVEVAGKTARIDTPVAAGRARIAYISRDRQTEALLRPLSVFKNIGLSSLARNSTLGVVSSRREGDLVAGSMASLGIKAGGPEVPVSTLSGGNQQKVVIARVLANEPAVVLADEPSQGVDAGARLEIYQILRAAADQGRAVIIASADAIELQGLCDRVLVFSRGRVVRDLAGDELTEHNITHAALTATTLRTQASTRKQVSSLARFLTGDFAPGLFLAFSMLVLAAYVASVNPYYLTAGNFGNVLTLATALSFVVLGQLTVMLTAGIDLSLGPLTGFAVVVASFFILDDVGPAGIALGFFLALLASLLVGTVNFALIRWVGIVPVVATLSTFMALRGLSLFLRDIPGGLINSSVTAAIGTRIGFVPVAFVIVILLAIGMEWATRRTRWGLSLRAVGSHMANARRIGVPVGAVLFSAYAIAALFAYLGALMLMAQIGIGDPTAGVDYTMMSVTAVVLGGASLFGGRGSYVGALLGALLVQQVFNVTTFLKLPPAWQYLLLGALTISAVALYSHFRRRTGHV
ncbi:MAG: ATP-binding cassette domain-containing protein [Rhodobacteraceae bacterium]|jgi:ribose transport system ATP-binding protein|nr:ATP-binding cassette domain-containing protein [Paracoccaceae bacterium]